MNDPISTATDVLKLTAYAFGCAVCVQLSFDKPKAKIDMTTRPEPVDPATLPKLLDPCDARINLALPIVTNGCTVARMKQFAALSAPPPKPIPAHVLAAQTRVKKPKVKRFV